MNALRRLGLATLLFGLIAAVTLARGGVAAAPVSGTFDGVVDITTASGGKVTYITVAAPGSGPLTAAFTVQYQDSVPPLAVNGLGVVTVEQSVLRVTFRDGSAVLFKFPSYEGAIPAGARALDVIGIATHAAAASSSHEAFVASVANVLESEEKCDYSRCACGGKHAQSCNCEGHSVSCYAPYEACCNSSNGFCCQAAGVDDSLSK